MAKSLKLGTLTHFCDCLTSTGHITESFDNETCLYCGFYTEQRKLTQCDINREKRFANLLKKKNIDLNELKKEVWEDNKSTIRHLLGVENDT